MYLKLKSLLPIAIQNTKEIGCIALNFSCNMGEKIIISFKAPGKDTKYVLGFLDLDVGAFTSLVIVYSEISEALKEKSLYRVAGDGTILFLAADKQFDKYEMKYYFVPEKFDDLIEKAMEDYI